MKTILLALCMVICAGCSNLIVPRTEIGGTIAGQPFSFSSPKNYQMTNFVVEVVTRTSWGDTNTTRLTIGAMSAVMDPAIVQMSGETFIQGMTIVKEGVLDAAKAAK